MASATMTKEKAGKAKPPMGVVPAQTFPLAAFKRAYGIVARAVPARSPKPVLECVKLDLEPGWATFQATDLEIGIRHRMQVDFDGEPVSCLLPLGTTNAILRVADGELLGLEFAGESIEITADRARWTVRQDDPKLHMGAPDFTPASWYSLEADRLLMGIRRTIHAVDRKSVRYALAGVCFELLLTAFEMTATNCNAIAVQRLAAGLSGKAPEFKSHPIVPEKALKFAQQFLADSEEVDFGFPDENSIHFRMGNEHDGTTILSARLVEGRFPRCGDAVPGGVPAGRITLAAGPLRALVARATTHLSDDSRRMNMRLDEEGLTFTCQSDIGNAEAAMTVEWEADPASFDIQPAFISAVLDGLEPDAAITLETRGETDPIVIRTDDLFLGVFSTLKKDPHQ